jgi:hypothetical protein
MQVWWVFWFIFWQQCKPDHFLDMIFVQSHNEKQKIQVEVWRPPCMHQSLHSALVCLMRKSTLFETNYTKLDLKRSSQIGFVFVSRCDPILSQVQCWCYSSVSASSQATWPYGLKQHSRRLTLHMRSTSSDKWTLLNKHINAETNYQTPVKLNIVENCILTRIKSKCINGNQTRS